VVGFFGYSAMFICIVKQRVKNQKQNVMLERISWGQYWAAILIVSAIYYFILFVLLYQKGMLLTFRQKAVQPIKNQPQGPTLFATDSIPLEKTFEQDGEDRKSVV
jgi:hypothetical protein